MAFPPKATAQPRDPNAEALRLGPQGGVAARTECLWNHPSPERVTRPGLAYPFDSSEAAIRRTRLRERADNTDARRPLPERWCANAAAVARLLIDASSWRTSEEPRDPATAPNQTGGLARPTEPAKNEEGPPERAFPVYLVSTGVKECWEAHTVFVPDARRRLAGHVTPTTADVRATAVLRGISRALNVGLVWLLDLSAARAECVALALLDSARPRVASNPARKHLHFRLLDSDKCSVCRRSG